MDTHAYQALRERAAWIDLSGRGKIRITGDDRVRFLHAMCTNHIQQLQPGTGCYAFFLSSQGRILADANIFGMPDYLLLDTEPETKNSVLQHLEKFIIADDVALHDFTDATATIAVEGPEAEAILNGMGAMPAHLACSLVEWSHSQIAHWSWTGGKGYALFVPVEEKDAVVSRLKDAGVPQADAATANLLRLENRHPRYGVDFTEANIPQESAQMGAIHFSKGCYLGQEIVERVRSRGHVNRQLVPIAISGQQVPAKGTPVESDGKSVGEVTSAAWSPALEKVVGFAILRTEAMQASTPLSVIGSSAQVVK